MLPLFVLFCVAVIAGNHDLTFHERWYENRWSAFHPAKYDTAECRSLMLSRPEITYLEDSSVVIGGIKIHGAPW